MHTVAFAALGEPSRLRIVELLRERPFGVNEVADLLALRQPQASKHLRVLREAGIVESQAVARRRIYRLRTEPFDDLQAWLGTFEQTWDRRLDRLGEVLHETTQGREPHERLT